MIASRATLDVPRELAWLVSPAGWRQGSARYRLTDAGQVTIGTIVKLPRDDSDRGAVGAPGQVWGKQFQGFTRTILDSRHRPAGGVIFRISPVIRIDALQA